MQREYSLMNKQTVLRGLIFALLSLLILWQPTLLLHNQPTVSCTPSSPARCPELARKMSQHWQMFQGFGAYRRRMCTYVQLPIQTDTFPHRHAPPNIFIQITPSKNKISPNSQRSQFGINSVLHRMPSLSAMTAHSITSCPADWILHPRFSWTGRGIFGQKTFS